MIKISVIIPVYNAAAHIEECLDSVLNQSLGKETEIICIDDGSKDNCFDIIKKYSEKDKRIKLLKQKNTGAGAARNNGIKAASGEFVAFMDSDDFYPENTTLEKLYDNAVKNEVNICGGSFSSLDKYGNVNDVYSNNYAKYTFCRNEKIKYADYQFDYGFHRFIYKREFLVKNNIFFPHLRSFEDPPFFVNAMIKAGEFYAIKDIVYRYRNGYKNVNWTDEKIIHLLEGLTYNFQTAIQYDLSNLYYLTFDRFVGEFIPKLSCIRTWSFFFKLIKIRLITDRKNVNVNLYRKFRRFLVNVFFETILSVKSSSEHTIITLLGVQLKFKKNKRKKAYFDSPVRIAIQNNQGFGDCLMEAAFWKEVKKQIPDIIIDYFARSYAAFAKNPLFNVTAPYSQKLDYKKYDLVLLNDRLYRVKKYNREKIKLKAPLLMKYVDETTKILGILPNMNYAVIAGFAALFGKNRRGHFDIRDIFSYDADTKPFVSWNLDAFSVLDEYQLKHNAYMTVSRACDDIFKNGHVKMWPLKYYNELIKLLKEKRPDIKIVQLGSSKDYGSIDGVDINLLSKTSFDELNVLLKYSLLHIDSDGGLVHLRNALGGKSCVVWGPTSPDIFGYSENINITSKACVNSCSYLSKNWARQCIRGFNESKCMTSINPETVADEIIKYIDSISERNFELYLVNNEVLSTFLQEYSSKNIKTALFASDFADYFQIPNIDLYVCDSTKILKNGNCAPELSFIYNIGKAGNSYDAVFVNMPLDEKYKEFFYKEMGRILKPGGKCYMFS